MMENDIRTKTKYCFSVFVGGGEINDYYLTKEEANILKNEWINKGYDDVVITELKKEGIKE